MRNKQEITEKLLALMPDHERPSVEQAMMTWWFNIRENGGFRLSDTGYRALKKTLKLESYRFEINTPRKNSKNKRLILALDRKLNWPYYMEKNWVEFFNSKEAMMAQMYPSLESWLELY